MKANETTIEELQAFRSSLYPYLLSATMAQKPRQTNEDDLQYIKRRNHDWEEFYDTRLRLIETYGRLASVIQTYARRPTVFRTRRNSRTPVDAGDVAFGSSSYKDIPAMQVAINQIDYEIVFAIGNLSGEADRNSAQAESAERPRVFISQAGPSSALDKLTKFLRALGLEPVIVQDQPSQGRSVAKNIDRYLDNCDCAIILATKGDIDARTKNRIPRANITHEIGMCKVRFPNRVIYLKEKGVQFPSNISEHVWESFAPNHMDKAFIKVVSELSASGLIRGVKPSDH